MRSGLPGDSGICYQPSALSCSLSSFLYSLNNKVNTGSEVNVEVRLLECDMTAQRQDNPDKAIRMTQIETAICNHIQYGSGSFRESHIILLSTLQLTLINSVHSSIPCLLTQFSFRTIQNIVRYTFSQDKIMTLEKSIPYNMD